MLGLRASPAAAVVAPPAAPVVAALPPVVAPAAPVAPAPVAKPPPQCPQLTAVDPPWLVVGPPPPPSAQPPVAPRSLERRIAFWLKVWGERGDNQHFLVDERHPWVVHAEVDCRDLFAGAEPGSDAAATAKDACGQRLTTARKAAQAQLKKNWATRTVLRLYDNDRSLAKSADKNILDVTGRKDALARAKSRAEPALGLAEGHFANADVPRLYARAAIVESLWRPEALSRSGAGGVYQFMPKTGRQYLTVEDGVVDERLDPLRSAWAAATYLAKLSHEFDGDWPLALTAYNTGPSRLKKVIKARHTHDIGKIADGGDLGEFGFDGENYYAQIAAIGRLTADDRFEPKPVIGHAVRIDSALPFGQLAACVEAPAAALASANPALAQDVVDGKVNVPVGYVAHVPTTPVTTASR